MTPPEISPEQQLEHIRRCAVAAVKRLLAGGRTVSQVRKALAAGYGHKLRQRMAWLDDAWAAVSALDQLKEMKDRHARGELRPILITDDLPF